MQTAFFASMVPVYSDVIEKKPTLHYRTITATGESIPVIGMGSWLTFDVGRNVKRRQEMAKVLKVFHNQGGRVIDSSPMYGTSQRVISQLAMDQGILNDLWVSTKVWTTGRKNGSSQMNESLGYFQNRLMVNHVHNIRDFNTHYPALKKMKAEGKIKYVGVSHYLNSAHDNLKSIVEDHEIDFVQVNFNLDNPAASDFLIPYCLDNGVAVIINRPFQGGRLFQTIQNEVLPGWAESLGITTWASYFLKFIISHPGVTCAIPATTQVAHVKENMEAGQGYLPSEAERQRMLEYYRSIT